MSHYKEIHLGNSLIKLYIWMRSLLDGAAYYYEHNIDSFATKF